MSGSHETEEARGSGFRSSEKRRLAGAEGLDRPARPLTELSMGFTLAGRVNFGSKTFAAEVHPPCVADCYLPNAACVRSRTGAIRRIPRGILRHVLRSIGEKRAGPSAADCAGARPPGSGALCASWVWNWPGCSPPVLARSAGISPDGRIALLESGTEWGILIGFRVEGVSRTGPPRPCDPAGFAGANLQDRSADGLRPGGHGVLHRQPREGRRGKSPKAGP